MARYRVRITKPGLPGEARTEIERDLDSEEFVLAKIEALRLANDLPHANRIILYEGASQVAVCRLEQIVAESSSGAVESG